VQRQSWRQKNYAYHIIREYGADSQQYLSLCEGYEYFFGSGNRGVISYTLTGKRPMTLGDPVCASCDSEHLLIEYMDFCGKRGYKPIFNSVSSGAADILKKHGCRVMKYGEEAVLKLDEYTLAGGQKAALRRNVNKADKSGVALTEYCPSRGRDFTLEKEIAGLAEQWFANKEYKLEFSVGDLHFDEPFDRRYFVTRDQSGDLLTALSFLPYNGGSGYCVDVMYRKIGALTGVMDHALICAAMKLKTGGASEVSLGLAPLAGIDTTAPDVSRAEKLMNAIFRNANFYYDFKNLYRFKNKYDPTLWKPRYLAYHRGISLVYAAIAITTTKRSAGGIGLYVRYKLFIIGFTLFPKLYESGNK
jgi:lysylphosphatidylglycerol synthetase-like protein (DUF2156 family)